MEYVCDFPSSNKVIVNAIGGFDRYKTTIKQN